MEKAYDVKDLVAKLKDNGLEVAEESAKVIVSSVISWVQESAAISPTPYDDILSVVLPIMKKEIDKKIEGINPND